MRAAYSPNVKERGDCSTAICDTKGRTLSLTAAAPAYLGAALRLVPQILVRFPLHTLRPGDAFLANDPYLVGVASHDCTVVTPVFHAESVVAFTIPSRIIPMSGSCAATKPANRRASSRKESGTAHKDPFGGHRLRRRHRALPAQF